MAVIRVNKKNDYTVMSNVHFKERKMSLKAKGLLSLMLSLPDEWDYSVEGLMKLSSDGKSSVTSALQELERLNYLKRTLIQGDGGKFNGYIYDIYEVPYTENPFTEKPFTENPLTENRAQSNTNRSNTKELNTKEYKNNKRAYRSYVESYTSNDDLRNALMAWVEMRIVDRKAFTHRALELALQKLDKLTDDDRTKIQIVNESIERGWLSFFEPKKKTWAEQFKDAMAWAEKEDRKRELEEKKVRGDINPTYDKQDQIISDDEVMEYLKKNKED